MAALSHQLPWRRDNKNMTQNVNATMHKFDSATQIRRIIEEKVNNKLKAPIYELINAGALRSTAEIIQQLDLKSIEEDVCRDVGEAGKISRKSRETWTNFSLDYYDYTIIVENLATNSTITKLKTLEELLNIQIIDTKQKHWGDLSQSLRKCLLNANNEVFSRTLRIYHRIVAFPNTSCDGYLSLLQAAHSLLNSRYLVDSNKNRVVQTLKIVLTGQKIVVKSLLHLNHKQIDAIIAAFVAVISCKSAAGLVADLDTEGEWVQNFCYGAYIRGIFFENLKQKSPNFVKTILKNFLNNPSKFDGYFLMYFLSYRSNLSFFPAKLEANRAVTISQILETTVLKINLQKNSELIKIFAKLVDHNPNLISAPLLDLLFQPLADIDENNVVAAVEANKHVVVVVASLAKSPNFGVLFGNCNKLKSRNRQIARKTANFPLKIVEITGIFLKKCPGDNGEILGLLECCRSIYQSHSASFYYVNPFKLVESLFDFYRTSLRFSNELKNEILNLFCCFYSNYPQIVKIIGCDNRLLGDLFAFNSPDSLKLVVNSIAADPAGFEFLKNNQLLKPYLENLWFLEEKEDYVQLDDATLRFLFFLFVVKLNFRAISALLLEENDNTVIVESDTKPSVLGELIEKSWADYCGSCEERLGLLAVKVLITNLNVMVYLEANYQIREKLTELQAIRLRGEAGFIIDHPGVLRQNILHSLQLIGFPERMVDEKKSVETVLMEFSQELGLEGAKGSELQLFLDNNPKKRDFGWLLQARRAFKNSLHVPLFPVIFELLAQVPKTYVYRKVELSWPPEDSVYYQLYPEDFCGISTIINFGQKIGLLTDGNHSEKLALLIKQSRAFLRHRPEEFSSFDWFVGLVYLISSDDKRCQSALVDFTNTQVTSLIWSTFGKEFDTSFQESFYQQLAIVLEENCQSFLALKMLGMTPELLTQSWLNQCFFNLLSFEEICNFLIFSILYPPECLLYYMVAIFQHLTQRICVMTHTETLENVLNMLKLDDFRLKDHLEAIEGLMRQYRNAHKI